MSPDPEQHHHVDIALVLECRYTDVRYSAASEQVHNVYTDVR